MTFPGGPPPPVYKPSILDRLTSRLFNTGAYGGLLDPQGQSDFGRQGLLQLGAGLLSQSYGPGNIGSALGNALQGVNFPGMMQNVSALQTAAGQRQLQYAQASDLATQAAQRAQQTAMGAAIYERQLAQRAAFRQAHPEYAAVPDEQLDEVIKSLYQPSKFVNVEQPFGGPPVSLQTEGSGAGQFRTPSGPAIRLGPSRTPYVTETDPATGVITYKPVMPFMNLPGNPTGAPIQVPGAPPKVPQAQLDQADFGAGALAAWQTAERERAAHPGVEEEVGKILSSPTFVQAVPGFKTSADAVLALQRAGGSNAAQRYMRAQWSFLDNIIRTRVPGARMSGEVMANLKQEFMPSLDTEGNAQIRTNAIRAILTAQGRSGYDQNPAIWNNAIKRQGLEGIDLMDALKGGSRAKRLNENPRYK